MNSAPPPIPGASYGVLLKDSLVTELDEIAEQVRRLGYAVLDSGFSAVELELIANAFQVMRVNYIQRYGEVRLRSANELHTIRAPFAHGDPVFVQLAMNQNLIAVLKKLIVGKFILNQQNGLINPPREAYNQGRWHRDLPYQHYISNTPLAINALFCVDDFTSENGSTLVLPATHKSVNCPSHAYIQRNALRIEAKAGQYVLLDCMLFHSGGFNTSQKERRAVNHVYTIPYFKQQIKISGLIEHIDLDPIQREIFGLNYQEPTSIDQYLDERVG